MHHPQPRSASSAPVQPLSIADQLLKEEAEALAAKKRFELTKTLMATYEEKIKPTIDSLIPILIATDYPPARLLSDMKSRLDMLGLKC